VSRIPAGYRNPEFESFLPELLADFVEGKDVT
jgi:hypothetical protein